MKKHVLKELERIQRSIPQEMIARLTEIRSVSPTLKKVVDIAINELDDPKKVEQLKNLRDMGLFNKKEETLNKTAQHEIDKYVTEQIGMSVLAGRLPKPKNSAYWDKLIKKCRKQISSKTS